MSNFSSGIRGWKSQEFKISLDFMRLYLKMKVLLSPLPINGCFLLAAIEARAPRDTLGRGRVAPRLT